MKPWCFSGNTIWTFNKETNEWKDRNIEKICGINYFHSIRANSMYVTTEALSEIWGFIDSYHVSLDGTTLDTHEKRHRAFQSFDNWEILNPDGTPTKKSKRNDIKNQIQNARYNSIEEQWSVQFENGWARIISEINQAVIDIQNGKPIMLTSHAASQLMKYLVMFDWRGFSGNSELQSALEWIDSILPFSEVDIPKEERVLPSCDNILEDFKHNILIKQFDKFQAGQGVMYTQQKAWEEHCTFMFLLPPHGYSFISSDNPCFTFVDKNGCKEPFFVALPQLALILTRKNPDAPNAYFIRKLTEIEIAEYNLQIFNHASTLVLNSSQFDTTRYLSATITSD